MNIKNSLEKSVALFEQSKDNIWTDPYISKNMLANHLDEQENGATRNKRFVDASVEWFSTSFPANEFPKFLDLGCGPGIYSEKFYEKGYQVTGIDFSKGSIQYARKSAKEKGYHINYLLQNYLEAELKEKTYDIIVIIYCDLGVLSPENRKILLQKAICALKPDGKLIFDVFTENRYREFQPAKNWCIEESNFWSQAACLHLQENKRYEMTNTYLETHFLIYKDSYKEFYLWENTFTVEQLRDELAGLGIRQTEVFSDISGKKWQEDSETICLVGTK